MIDYQSEPFASLVGRAIPVLDFGSVKLIDAFGSDADIVAAARKSYRNGSRRVSSDRDLIRYMMRHHHSTPFERCEVVLELVIPNGDAWRQMIRHRSASIWDESSMFDEPTVNAFSFRYGETPTEFHRTDPEAWRSQSADNKQGSGGPIDEWSDALLYRMCLPMTGSEAWPDFVARYPTPGHYFTSQEGHFLQQARAVYQNRLLAGVAFEQARKDLPNSIFTTAQWKSDLRNVLHFLALRMDSHTQEETRAYAEAIGREIVAKLWPETWEAFNDYVLGSMTLSLMEVEAVRMIQDSPTWEAGLAELIPNARERGECLAKLARLGLVPTGVTP